MSAKRQGQIQQSTWVLTVTYYLSAYCFLGSTSNSIFECWEQHHRNREFSCLTKARNTFPFSDGIPKPTPAASLGQPGTPRQAALGPGRRCWEPGEIFPTLPWVPGRVRYLPSELSPSEEMSGLRRPSCGGLLEPETPAGKQKPSYFPPNMSCQRVLQQQLGFGQSILL